MNAGKHIVSSFQYGYNGGASQAGIRNGRREIGGIDPGRAAVDV